MRGSLSRELYLILVCWTGFIMVDGEWTDEMPWSDRIYDKTDLDENMSIVVVFYIQKNMQLDTDMHNHINLVCRSDGSLY